MKRSLFLCIFPGIGLTLFLHFYSPYERLGKKISEYFTENAYPYLSIKEIRASFPNNLVLDDIVLRRGMGIHRGKAGHSRLSGKFDLLQLLRGNLLLKLKGKILGGNAEVDAKYFRKYDSGDPSDNMRGNVLELTLTVQPVTIPFFKVQKVIMPINKDSVVSGSILYTPDLMRFKDLQIDGSQYGLLLNGDLQPGKGWSTAPLRIDLTYKTAKGLRLAYGGLIGNQRDNRVRFLNPNGNEAFQNRGFGNNGPVINIKLAQTEKNKAQNPLFQQLQRFISGLKKHEE